MSVEPLHPSPPAAESGSPLARPQSLSRHGSASRVQCAYGTCEPPSRLRSVESSTGMTITRSPSPISPTAKLPLPMMAPFAPKAPSAPTSCATSRNNGSLSARRLGSGIRRLSSVAIDLTVPSLQSVERKRPMRSSRFLSASTTTGSPSPSEDDMAMCPTCAKWGPVSKIGAHGCCEASAMIDLTCCEHDECGAAQNAVHSSSTFACTVICDLCKQSVAITTGEEVVFLDECNHHICAGCATTIRKNSRSEDGASLRCPVSGCSSCVSQKAGAVALFGTEKQQATISSAFQAFVANGIKDGWMVRCPKCTAPIEKRRGESLVSSPVATTTTSAVSEQIDLLGTYQVEGKSMDLDALEHYSEHRLRCLQCSTVFCASCGAEPYHLGLTCEEYKLQQNAVPCRFCDDPADIPKDRGFFSSLFAKKRAPDACSKPECQEKAETVCHETLSCGHYCCGLPGESECLGCIQEGCPNNHTSVCSTDYCSICYVDELRQSACIKLKCGHVFHRDCIIEKLNRRWPGARVTFGFLQCPTCNAEIDHPSLKSILEPILAFRERLMKMMELRLEHEGLLKCDAVTNPESIYYQQPAKYGMQVLSYYECCKCKKPYFGGFKHCEAAMDEERGAFDPNELMCSACIPNKELRECPIHGSDFIEYKCRFCCNVAQWYCWGSTHFCTACHRRQETGDYVTKRKPNDLPQCGCKEKCPLGVDHPPNGTVEFALGCALCRRNTGKDF